MRGSGEFTSPVRKPDGGINPPLLPGWDIVSERGYGLLPIKHPRTRIGPSTRLLHEAFSNWVVEDVPCHSVVIVIASQNVVVESFLPEITNAEGTSLRCGDALEVVKEHERIRGGRKAYQFEM
jgi:hypothetical protein